MSRRMGSPAAHGFHNAHGRGLKSRYSNANLGDLKTGLLKIAARTGEEEPQSRRRPVTSRRPMHLLASKWLASICTPLML
jgi:hypothetical protein